MNIDYSLGEVQKVARLATKAINSDIILLSGEVGVGKTTLIKEILRKFLSPSGCFLIDFLQATDVACWL